jgi:hypothetical protein
MFELELDAVLSVPSLFSKSSPAIRLLSAIMAVIVAEKVTYDELMEALWAARNWRVAAPCGAV